MRDLLTTNAYNYPRQISAHVEEDFVFSSAYILHSTSDIVCTRIYIYKISLCRTVVVVNTLKIIVMFMSLRGRQLNKKSAIIMNRDLFMIY